jgi:hypothetical protein
MVEDKILKTLALHLATNEVSSGVFPTPETFGEFADILFDELVYAAARNYDSLKECSELLDAINWEVYNDE